MKHFIETASLKREEVEEIFKLTDNIIAKPNKYKNALSGCVCATIFNEPSTRTRISFESAVQQMGGIICSTENAKDSSSNKKGETIEDSIRSVEGYVNLVVMRHPDPEAAEKATSVARIPIISAGCGAKEHPTQGLVEVYTMRQYNKGKIDGLKIAILGDLKNGRTLHSLLNLIGLFNNITIYGYPVKGLELPEEYINYLAKNNSKYVECDSLEKIPSDVNFIYQTRVQKERIADPENFHGIILNKENYTHFSNTTYLMHPLPRVDEISPDLDKDPRAIYFEEAKNGLPIRKAICYIIMKDYLKK